MKKIFILALMVIVLSTVFTGTLNASSTKIYGNFGILTDDSFTFADYLWTIGVNFDFSINDLFMISPELNLLTYKFEFSPLFFEPAIMANFKLGTLFFGAGLSTTAIVSGSSTVFDTDFSLKLNAGFRSSHMKFRVYLITPFNDLLGSNSLGASIGIGF